MKICFLICGLPRSTNIVISNIKELFKHYDNTFYISTTHLNNTVCDNVYFNKYNYCDLYNDVTIKNILSIKNEPTNSYRNSLNYIKKISYGIKIIDEEFDLFFVIRSDCILNNIDFLTSIIQDSDNMFYMPSLNKNAFSIPGLNKINEHIIITKKYEYLTHLLDLYNFATLSETYSDIVLYNYLHSQNINYKLIDIDYKLILSHCNIIAISGDSGSGKSTLLQMLMHIFMKDTAMQFETDRYHKWERGDINYNKYTHLNPYSNHLELMSQDVFNLKIGNEIYQVDYDHHTGKFTHKDKIKSNQNILLCGLHTLYVDKINEIIDIKIFMDTDRDLIKKWKIQRDTTHRNYSLEKILTQIEHRNQDYYDYIYCQKQNADIVINFYEIEEDLLCNFIIKQNKFFNKISKYVIKYNYNTTIIDNSIIIQLKNNIQDIYINENIQKYYTINTEILSTYYDEILIFLILYIYG